MDRISYYVLSFITFWIAIGVTIVHITIRSFLRAAYDFYAFRAKILSSFHEAVVNASYRVDDTVDMFYKKFIEIPESTCDYVMGKMNKLSFQETAFAIWQLIMMGVMYTAYLTVHSMFVLLCKISTLVCNSHTRVYNTAMKINSTIKWIDGR